MKTLAIISAIISIATGATLAHSGGLDQNGGHYDHKTGGYHYHR